jgi:hypothetical protein
MSDVIEVAYLACKIGEAIGFTFADAGDPADSEHLNSDGAWEYHFETAPQWGFLGSGPGEESIETSHDAWGTLIIKPYHWYVFREETLAAVFTPTDGTVVGTGALEDTMVRAFQLELDALDGEPGGEGR